MKKSKKDFVRYMEFEIPSSSKVGEDSRTIVGGIEISEFVTNIKVRVLCSDNVDGKGLSVLQNKKEKKRWEKLMNLLKNKKLLH